MTLVVVLALVILFALGAPLFAVMLGAAIVGAVSSSARTFDSLFSNQVMKIISTGTEDAALVLSTIPLFIFTGFLMSEARTADRLVRCARAAVGWVPGGLAIVTVFACAIFTTFTGASGVTIVALGGLVMPSLLKEGYPERFSLGLVAGTGSVGLLFPPALPLILFATVFSISAIGSANTDAVLEFKRFLFAGVVPGLVLVALLCIYAVLVAVKSRVPRTRFDFRELATSTALALPELMLPVIILGGMVGLGIPVPEVAALGTLYILLLEVVLYREIGPRDLWRIVRESMSLVGAIFIIIFASTAFVQFLVDAEVPQMMVSWIRDTFESKWTFLLALNLVLLLVGMTMDIFSAILIMVPLLIPATRAFQIDPYHFGVIFLLNLEIGYLTPPVGLNLFVTGFAFKRPIPQVIRATLPFLACMIVALALVTYVPALTMVPPAERRGRVAQMSDEIHRTFQQLNAVRMLTLPDESVVRKADCAALEDGLAKDDCNGIFIDVTTCRAKSSVQEAAACEEAALESYAADRQPIDEDAWEDDWDEEWEDGAEAGEGGGPAAEDL